MTVVIEPACSIWNRGKTHSCAGRIFVATYLDFPIYKWHHTHGALAKWTFSFLPWQLPAGSEIRRESEKPFLQRFSWTKLLECTFLQNLLVCTQTLWFYKNLKWIRAALHRFLTLYGIGWTHFLSIRTLVIVFRNISNLMYPVGSSSSISESKSCSSPSVGQHWRDRMMVPTSLYSISRRFQH